MIILQKLCSAGNASNSEPATMAHGSPARQAIKSWKASKLGKAMSMCRTADLKSDSSSDEDIAAEGGG